MFANRSARSRVVHVNRSPTTPSGRTPTTTKLITMTVESAGATREAASKGDVRHDNSTFDASRAFARGDRPTVKSGISMQSNFNDASPPVANSTREHFTTQICSTTETAIFAGLHFVRLTAGDHPGARA